jgi:hypothetical protein
MSRAQLALRVLATFEENDTSCCYAVQDKVLVHGPGREPWEVYVAKADAANLGKSDEGTRHGDPSAAAGACCGTTGCCTTAEAAVDPAQAPAQAKIAAGCACED